MKHINIVEYHNQILSEPSSEFILDRYDLLEDDYYSYEIISADKEFNIEGVIDGEKAILGVSYLDISKATLDALIQYIFQNHKNVKEISFYNLPFGMGYHVGFYSYRIFLPATVEELHKRLSSKGWYNIRRERKMINEKLGKTIFMEYDRNNIPLTLVELYFKMKKSTHAEEYGLSPESYLINYHITNAYALYSGDKVLSIIFSCEQLDGVFLENLSYDILQSHFSPGQVLYDYYLTRLIAKGKKVLYLGGGSYSYKKRYSSTEDYMYSSIVFRNLNCYLRFVIKKLRLKILSR